MSKLYRAFLISNIFLFHCLWLINSYGQEVFYVDTLDLKDQEVGLFIECQYNGAGDFKEGFAMVSKGDKWAIINKKGDLVTGFEYSEAGDFFGEGLINVKKNGFWGYVNKKGETVIPFKYKQASIFQSGLALATVDNKKFFFMNKYGEKMKFSFAAARPFNDGLALLRATNGPLCFIDNTGQIVINSGFDLAQDFNGGISVVRKNERWGAIDTKGNLIVDFRYEFKSRCENGYVELKLNSNDVWHRFSNTGRELHTKPFNEDWKLAFLHEGYMKSGKVGAQGFMNSDAKVVVPRIYAEVENFSNGYARVKKNELWGYVKIYNNEDKIINYVNIALNKWETKGKYEKSEDYQKRVTINARNKFINDQTITAIYVLASTEDFSKMKTEYDADNELFKIKVSKFAPFFIKVPIDEAESFDKNISTIKFKDEEYTLSQMDLFILTSASVTLPSTEKTYHIDNSIATQFTIARIDKNFEKSNFNISKQSVKSNNEKVSAIKVGLSDVDVNIPKTGIENLNAFALIIGNENYSKEITVPFAKNDASTFKKYASNILGVPDKQIHLVHNATYGQMLSEIDWISKVIEAYDGQAKVYVYYAGHGLPDESTKSAYILPVDGYSGNLNTSVKLADLYGALTKSQSKGAVVFLDACFSGGSRTENLASGRGVKIKPKSEILEGNLIVLSASSGEETAHPFSEKSHGLFTYYLLKYMQETKGKSTWFELYENVENNVSKVSIVNDNSQSPSVLVSPEIQATWKSIEIK